MLNQNPTRFGATLSVALVIGLLTLTVGCGGGGGGGGAVGVPGGAGAVLSTSELEQNDSVDTATHLPWDTAGMGELDLPEDVDFWSFDAVAGQVVTIEVRAFSLDQESWREFCNSPVIEIRDPAGDVIVTHDDAPWNWRALDLDMPRIAIGMSGPHHIVLRNRDDQDPGGSYSVRVGGVALPALQLEQEPMGTPGLNDTVMNAEPLQPGTLWGYHVDQEHDYYRFTVTEPSVVRCEITAYRNGMLAGETRYYDPLLRLRDANGAILTLNDDTYFYDSQVDYYFSTPGDYYVDVSEYSGNQADGEYLLTLEVDPVGAPEVVADHHTVESAHPIGIGQWVETTPAAGVPDYYVFEGRAGDLLRVLHWSGSTHQSSQAVANYSLMGPDGVTEVSMTRGARAHRSILTEDGPHYLRVEQGVAMNPYAFRVIVLEESIFEIEPNHDSTLASTLLRQAEAAGRIESVGDADLYRLDVQLGELVTLSVYSGVGQVNGFSRLARHGSDLLPRLRVLDQEGNVLAETNVISGQNCAGAERVSNGLACLELSLFAEFSGQVFLEVTASDGTGGTNHTYVLSRN